MSREIKKIKRKTDFHLLVALLFSILVLRVILKREQVGRGTKFNKKKQLSPFHKREDETSKISTIIKAKKIDMALLQTNRLLYDCVREAVETRKRKYAIGQQMQFLELFWAEEIAKMICENIREWCKQCVDKNEMTQVLNLASREEWSDFEQERKEISMVIGDLILENIIRNEFCNKNYV